VRINVRFQSCTLRGRPGLCITFRDNGPGIAEEDAVRIFEPFFTTKTQGTGLGMAIARRIMEAHGGDIAVGERTEPGAEITMRLPQG
jgi:signal transduction histidine kinase